MKPQYLGKLSALLLRQPWLGKRHDITFKSHFGAVAASVDGSIFLSGGRFGIALKLPPDTLATLLPQRGVRRLKYFPRGHVKKDYAVLPRRLLESDKTMKRLMERSLDFVLQPQR